MTWEKEQEPIEEPKEEPKAEEPAAEPDVPVEEPKAEEPVETKPEEPKPEEPKADEPEKAAEDLVPRKLIGAVARKIREKGRNELAEINQKLSQLEEENRQLKARMTGEWQHEEPASNGDGDIDQKVHMKFLQLQDAYGREKYGQDYNDALLLVQSQNDPVLVRKIQTAATPADTLMREAQRIAEDLQYGSDPRERERKKLEELKSSWRKEWEAEVSAKVAARQNQPTDVQKVRAAGGDERPKPVLDTWATSLPK